jgi:hypothetical protein
MKTTKALFGTLAITAAIATQVQAQSFLTNGLVAYYPFNGNANDESGNGNNGTTFGSADIFSPDRFNQNSASLILSNGAFFDCGILLNPSAGNYTESCWINSTQALELSPTVSGAYRRIHFMTRRTGFETDGNATGHGGWLDICTSETGQLSVRIMDDFYGAGNDITLGRAPTNTVVLNGKWHHLLAVYSYPTNELFLDGVNVVSYVDNHIMTASDGTRHFWCGSSASSFSNPGDVALFRGQIDDVRIYNRALSANEVQQLYDYESGPRVDLIKAVKPSFRGLTFTTNYQLQVSGDLNNWTNQGSVFAATNSSMVYPQYFDAVF